MISKPAAGMATLGAMASMADLEHLGRIMSVSQPARRPAAVLFADLEASSPLARRLSTAATSPWAAGWFALPTNA